MKRYWLKEAYMTNLDSMETTAWLQVHDMESGEIKKDPYYGEGLEYWENLLNEIRGLMERTWDGKAVWKDYKRIRELSDERNIIRYSKCMANGMDEDKAGYAFL